MTITPERPGSPPGGVRGEANRANWELVLEHRERLLRLAQGKLGNASDAEDCVQEAMLRVATHKALDPTRVAGLLTVVVSNLCMDQHRATARLRKAAPKLAEPEAGDGGVALVCDLAEARWLHEQASRLPQREQQVLAMRAAGSSAGETAEGLSVSYKAAESAYTRARSKLHAVWKATLGWLGCLLAPRLRSREGAAAVLVPAAALTAVTLLVLQQPVTSSIADAPPVPSPVPSLTQTGTTLRPLPPATARARPSQAAARPTSAQPKGNPRGPAAARPVPSPARPLGTGPVGDKRIVGTDGVSVTDRHEDESLQQTLDRCLRKGFVLTLEERRCAD